ncbi:MAG: DNA primase [bacterium]|nr:DNA primase [bacterium]
MDNKLVEIRNSNDIVEVISEYLPLTKRGKNYFGVCPFHDDTNPSMSVSSDKQIYKCFSCGASGNVFNFVMDYEKVDFKEAVSILAKRAGISLGSSALFKRSNKFDRYYEMYEVALKLYQNNINSAFGEAAINYLNERGISKELIKEFKIGLSLNKDSLSMVLVNKGYTNVEIERFGLGSGVHDLYINRIMFPLFDTSNRPVGFSGRIYNNSNNSKYINTKETPIFIKGDLLYNYYNCKEYVRHEKKLIIVEGFMDVIRLYSIGIRNVVALMGTSLTKNQIALIKRVTSNVYLCLDGDSAGRSAMNSIGEVLASSGFSVSVINLDGGYDPDEFILKYGENRFRGLYENAISFSEYKIIYMKEGIDLNDLDQKTNYINEVLKEVKSEDDLIKQEFMLKRIALEFDIDINILKNNLKNIQKCSKIKALSKSPVKVVKINKYDKATYNIIYTMMCNYEACKYFEKRLNFLPRREERYLSNEIIHAYKVDGKLVLADFITKLSDKPELFGVLQTVLSNVYEESSFEAFKDYITVIRDYNKDQSIKRLKSLMSEESDPVKQAEYLEKIRLVKMESEEE